VKAGKIKIRIMFTQNTHVALQLTKQHIDDRYFILYYHFIKNAFGLLQSPMRPLGRRGRPIKASTIAMDRSRIAIHVKPLLGKKLVRGGSALEIYE
jgi:hypothetical protein